MAKKLEAVFEMKLEQLQKLPSEVNEDLFEVKKDRFRSHLFSLQKKKKAQVKEAI